MVAKVTVYVCRWGYVKETSVIEICYCQQMQAGSRNRCWIQQQGDAKVCAYLCVCLCLCKCAGMSKPRYLSTNVNTTTSSIIEKVKYVVVQ